VKAYLFWLLPLSLVWLLTGCGGPSNGSVTAAQARGDQTLTIFAAASLTEAFTEMAAAFETENSGVNIDVNFASSNALRLQIEQGARPDLYASANTLHMDALFEAGLVDRPLIFAHNQLVVITPASNPAGLETLADLAKPGLKLVLAGPEVPVGRYARQSLRQMSADPALGSDFAGRVLANLVSAEETVKAVVAKVQLDEADAGIVYNSDVTPAVADQLKTIEIPAELNVVADYPLAVTADSRQPVLAQTFIDFVLSPSGQAVMRRHGFGPAGRPQKP
jgi:molybdate transport system substrate-binding protein